MLKKPILHLAQTSLLITHYNRSSSLKLLLSKMDLLNISFSKIIVSDDHSDMQHLSALEEMSIQFGFELLTTPVNKGLGASLNALQQAASSELLFYVQEDFVPEPSLRNALAKGVEIMMQTKNWDLIRFYAFPWAPYPYRRSFGNGFSELKFSLSPTYNSHLKFFMYSDHPHLKRREFARKFGAYREGVSGDQTEQGMCRAFLKNNGKALYYEDHQHLFAHENSADEPAQDRSQGSISQRMKQFAPVYSLYLHYRLARETFKYIFNVN